MAVVVLIGVAVGGFALTQLHRSTPTTALGPPHYVEEAAAAGIAHTYDGGPSFFVGGGVAVLDCNGDGRPDLYLAGGEKPAALYRNNSPVGGALRFSAVHDPVTDLTGVNGAYPIDIDGDGVVDLVVLRVGGAVLLRGLGDCRFERANERWSFDGGHGWATAFSAKWEGSAGLPTMALGNYLGLDASGTPTADCADDALLRPTAGGTGYGPPIPLTPGFCTLSMLFSDWDRSGRRDLRVSNDRHYYVNGEEQLWRVANGEPPRLYTAADGWVQMQIEGMGIASYDVTGDGYPDVFLTSQADNKLQTLTTGPGQPTYRDIALKRGVTAAQPATGGDVLPSTAWHPEFADVNNDGLADLLVTKGNVDAQVDQANKDPNNLFIGQPDGTFAEGGEEAGIVSYQRARGAAVVDLNLDGLLDMVIVNRRSNATVWRNVGRGDVDRPEAMGHWIDVRLQQPAPNIDAIGAWLDVRAAGRTTTREVTVGGGHVSGELGWLHSGIGSAADAEVRVQWPDGSVGPWMKVAADERVTIVRGETAPRPWSPQG